MPAQSTDGICVHLDLLCPFGPIVASLKLPGVFSLQVGTDLLALMTSAHPSLQAPVVPKPLLGRTREGKKEEGAAGEQRGPVDGGDTEEQWARHSGA